MIPARHRGAESKARPSRRPGSTTRRKAPGRDQMQAGFRNRTPGRIEDPRGDRASYSERRPPWPRPSGNRMDFPRSRTSIRPAERNSCNRCGHSPYVRLSRNHARRMKRCFHRHAESGRSGRLPSAARCCSPAEPRPTTDETTTGAIAPARATPNPCDGPTCDRSAMNREDGTLIIATGSATISSSWRS